MFDKVRSGFSLQEFQKAAPDASSSSSTSEPDREMGDQERGRRNVHSLERACAHVRTHVHTHVHTHTLSRGRDWPPRVELAVHSALQIITGSASSLGLFRSLTNPQRLERGQHIVEVRMLTVGWGLLWALQEHVT